MFRMGPTSPSSLKRTSFSHGRCWRRHHADVRVPASVPAVERPPFPFDLPVSQRVEMALERAIDRHDDTVIELRWAVEACARSLRDQGMSPEATIVTLKAFVKHSANVDP